MCPGTRLEWEDAAVLSLTSLWHAGGTDSTGVSDLTLKTLSQWPSIPYLLPYIPMACRGY